MKTLCFHVVDGFDQASLRQLLQFTMEIDLDEITREAPLNERVFELVTGLDREGRVGEFIDTVLAARPERDDIQTALSQLRLEISSIAGQPGSIPSHRLMELRERHCVPESGFRFKTPHALLVFVSIAAAANIGLGQDGLKWFNNLPPDHPLRIFNAPMGQLAGAIYFRYALYGILGNLTLRLLLDLLKPREAMVQLVISFLISWMMTAVLWSIRDTLARNVLLLIVIGIGSPWLATFFRNHWLVRKPCPE